MNAYLRSPEYTSELPEWDNTLKLSFSRLPAPGNFLVVDLVQGQRKTLFIFQFSAFLKNWERENHCNLRSLSRLKSDFSKVFCYPQDPWKYSS